MIKPTYAVARSAADRISRPFGESFRQTTNRNPARRVNVGRLDRCRFLDQSAPRRGVYPRISLAFVAPMQALDAVSFATSLSLDPRGLTKLAPAVERTGLHLGVWPRQDELCVWGIARSLPAFSLVLEVILPGLLVVKQSPSEEFDKFINIAVLQGDELKIIDPQAEISLAYPALLASLFRLESHFATSSAVNVLLQLAVSVRAHGRGGILLAVPKGSEAWTESILQPITYSVVPAFSGLADLMRKSAGDKPSRRREVALGRAVDGIAGLTAVDGATLITAEYELLAFGAKIIRRKGSPQVAQVVATEPIEGGSALIAEPGHFGGTRHLSAAQFVHDQRDAMALVASQDGQFTVFVWSPSDEKLHAHRIDALLL